MPASASPTAIYLEVGQKRVFACARDWPGWCRSARDEQGVQEALADYASRYRVVAQKARVRFPAAAGDSFEVLERVPGSATTDFGAPGQVPEIDSEPSTPAEVRRTTALLAASWALLDEVAAGAPAELRKGPRGGGRDRDKVVQHVLGAEAGYARKLGVKHKEPALGDGPAIGALRDAILDALGGATDGEPLTERGWPPRYAARRITWHVLDHAWEIQDRSET